MHAEGGEEPAAVYILLVHESLAVPAMLVYTQMGNRMGI
jgi:hypothetical protein